jgi:hypothetical protein
MTVINESERVWKEAVVIFMVLIRVFAVSPASHHSTIPLYSSVTAHRGRILSQPRSWSWPATWLVTEWGSLLFLWRRETVAW